MNGADGAVTDPFAAVSVKLPAMFSVNVLKMARPRRRLSADNAPLSLPDEILMVTVVPPTG